MDRRTRDAVFQLTGAIVGAGFASGREIMRFFSRYGVFSWIGIGLAVITIGAFALALLKKAKEADVTSLTQFCRTFLGKAGVVGSIAFAVLLGATGGSMLAASGEIGALALPIHGAYWIVLFVTLAAGLFFSRRSLTPLAQVGKLLVPALLIIFGLCLMLPEKTAVSTQALAPGWIKILEVALGGISYGALNVTLAAGVMCEVGRTMADKKAVRTAIFLGLCLLALLSLANAALMRQPQLQNAALPMVMLLNNYGKVGYWMAIIGLYLAVFSTLLAMTRGFLNMFTCYIPNWRAFAITGVVFLLFAVIGFARLVGIVYPALGFLCLLLLLWMLTGKKTPDGSQDTE